MRTWLAVWPSSLSCSAALVAPRSCARSLASRLPTRVEIIVRTFLDRMTVNVGGKSTNKVRSVSCAIVSTVTLANSSTGDIQHALGVSDLSHERVPEQVCGAHAFAAVFAKTLRHKVARLCGKLILREFWYRIVVQHTNDAPEALF